MTLRVEALTVRAGGRVLVGPADFAVAPGRPLTILGETGAGKSLLAQAIMGALPAALTASGAVRLGDERVDALPRRAREALWGRRVAMLPQEPWRALDPLMRSLSQVAETHVEVLGRDWGEARARARGALGALGLDARAMAARPGALSGGMAQRVAFAAATAAGAPVLLADEPTKGLDEARRDEVARLLRRFADEGGVLLTITHDVAVAAALGGDAMVLKDGAVIEQGAAAALLSAPASDYARALIAADPANWPQSPRAEGGEPALTAEDLAVARGGRVLVAELAFEVSRGGRLAVTGPSGLGKSTLLDTLAGLIEPAAGRVRRHGAAARPLAVQKLYQDPPAAFAPRVSLRASFGDLERRRGVAAGAVAAIAARLGLPGELLDRRPAEVSGGELQRLALARVLALRPAVILADEPTSRLDPVTQARVMRIIAEAGAEAGAAVVLVTHSATMAQRWAGDAVDLAAHALADEPAARSAPPGEPASEVAGTTGTVRA